MRHLVRTAVRLTVLASIAALGARSPANAQSGASTTPDGKKLYTTICAACHQLSGEGVEEKYPPLAGSEWAVGDDAQLVRIVLHGLSGPIDVSGQTFSGAMPAWGGTLTDSELAAVASYVRSAWGNKASPVSAANVTKIRKATASRTSPWTAQELAQFAR
jgi:mono/diheme cytochrome c family protein